MASQDEITKIISLELRYEDLLKGLSKVQAEFIKQNELLKDSMKAYKNEDISLKEHSQKLAEISTKKKELSAIMRQYQREILNNIKVETQAEGSLNELRAKVSNLTATFNGLGREMREGLEGKRLVEEISKIQKEISDAEISIGNFRSRVGSYADAAQGFTKLNYSIQQVLRETPSLTHSITQYFLAISNNLPMLADEIQRVRIENQKLQAQGLPTVSVIKQIVKSLFSWQSALMAVITLLTAFSDDIFKWVKGLFKGKEAVDAIRKSMEQLHNIQKQSIIDSQEEITRLRLTKEVAEDVTRSMDERLIAVQKLRDEYPDYLSKLSDEEILNGKLSGSVETLVKRIIKLNKARLSLNQLVENEENLALLNQVSPELLERLEKQYEAYEKYGSGKFGKGYFREFKVTNKQFLKELEKSGDEGANLVEEINENFSGNVAEYIKTIRAQKETLEESAKALFTDDEGGKKPPAPKATPGGGRSGQQIALDNLRKETEKAADATFRIYTEMVEKTRDEELRIFDETQARKLSAIEQRQQELSDIMESGVITVNGKEYELNESLSRQLLSLYAQYEEQKEHLTETGARERAEIENKWTRKALEDKEKADRAEIQEFKKQQQNQKKEFARFQQANQIEEQSAGTGGNELERLRVERQNLLDEEAKALQWQRELENGLYSDLIKNSEEYAAAKEEAANQVKASQLGIQKNEEAMKKAALSTAATALSGFSALAGGFSQLAEAMGADAGVVRGMAIAQSALAMAAGIAQAAMTPFPSNLAAIASVVATLATLITQVKQLNSESESEQYAQGGLIPVSGNAGIIKGKSHASGGVSVALDGRKVAEVEDGELLAVVNKKDTATLNALSSINSRHGIKFADGGLIDFSGVYSRINIPTGGNMIQTSDTSSALQYSIMRNAMMEAVGAMPTPIVGVRDVTTMQKRVKMRDSYAQSGRIKRKKVV